MTNASWDKAVHAFSPARHARLPDCVVAWTQTDFDIAQTLALRVRLLERSQAIRIWPDADERLPRLVKAGLIEQFNINAHPPLQPHQPLASWVPDQPEPDFHAISTRARTRWNQAAVNTSVFVASKRAANLFGGDAYGLPPVEHRDHDLLLSDAYVFYRNQRPDVAMRWVGEDFFPKAGFRIKDPDAFLVDDDGQFRCVIESAGRYSTQQVQSFHDYCAIHNLPYELW